MLGLASSLGPSPSFPPATAPAWASPEDISPIYRQQLGTGSSKSTAPCLQSEEKAKDVLLCLLFPLGLCESRRMTTQQPPCLRGGVGVRSILGKGELKEHKPSEAENQTSYGCLMVPGRAGRAPLPPSPHNSLHWWFVLLSQHTSAMFGSLLVLTVWCISIINLPISGL